MAAKSGGGSGNAGSCAVATAGCTVAGNNAGELWAIDSGGTLTQHGNFGTVPANDGHGHTYPAANKGQLWELSGDIVFLANGGSPVGFATVRDCPNPPSQTGCSTIDTLIMKLSVMTWATKNNSKSNTSVSIPQ